MYRHSLVVLRFELPLPMHGAVYPKGIPCTIDSCDGGIDMHGYTKHPKVRLTGLGACVINELLKVG